MPALNFVLKIEIANTSMRKITQRELFPDTIRKFRRVLKSIVISDRVEDHIVAPLIAAPDVAIIVREKTTTTHELMMRRRFDAHRQNIENWLRRAENNTILLLPE